MGLKCQTALCRIFWNSRLLVGSSSDETNWKKGSSMGFKEQLKASICMERAGCWEGVLGLLCFIPFANISADEHSLGRRWVGWTLGVTPSSHTDVP